MTIKQTTDSVNEITNELLEKALLSPDFVVIEDLNMLHYLNWLMADIWEFVVTARCKTLTKITGVARIRE